MSIKVKVQSTDLTARAEQAAEQAMKIVMGELEAAFSQSFTAKAWDWPRETVRGLTGGTISEKLENLRKGKGFVVGSPRNLIDIGNPGLRGMTYKEQISKYRWRFVWFAPYANLTHEGGWIRPWGNKNARVDIPARPWTSAVLGTERVAAIRPFPLQQRLKDVWMARFKGS